MSIFYDEIGVYNLVPTSLIAWRYVCLFATKIAFFRMFYFNSLQRAKKTDKIQFNSIQPFIRP